MSGSRQVLSFRSMISRLISVLALALMAFVGFSLAAHFKPDLLPGKPRLVFQATPESGPNVDWAYKALMSPTGFQSGEEMHPLTGPLRFIPLLGLLGAPFWLLIRSRSKGQAAAKGSSRPFDSHLDQIRELMKISANEDLLADTCDEVLSRYQGFLKEDEFLMVLKAQGRAKLGLGHGIDAITAFQRLREKLPEDPEVLTGLIRGYRIAGRNLPPPISDLLMRLIRTERPLHQDVVKFYLEQTLQPPRRGSEPLNIPSPIKIIDELGGDPLVEQIQVCLDELGQAKGPMKSRALTCLASISVTARKFKVGATQLRSALTAEPTLHQAYAMALKTFRSANDLAGLHNLYMSLYKKNPQNIPLQEAIQEFYDSEADAESFGENPLIAEVPVTEKVKQTKVPQQDGEEIEVDPTLTPEERFMVALNAIKMARPGSARQVLEQLVQSKFSRPDALYAALVITCIQQKDVVAAKSYGEKIDLFRLPAQEIYPLAREIESSGQLEWAKDVYLSLLEESPEFKDVQDRIIQIDRELEASGR